MNNLNRRLCTVENKVRAIPLTVTSSTSRADMGTYNNARRDFLKAIGFGGLAIPVIHDSPNKIGKNKVFTEIDGVVPEPATMVVLGLGGLVFLRKHR